MVEIAGLELASTCIQNRDFALSYISMVDEIGIEPITYGVRNRCCCQLSYSSAMPEIRIELMNLIITSDTLYQLSYSGLKIPSKNTRSGGANGTRTHKNAVQRRQFSN